MLVYIFLALAIILIGEVFYSEERPSRGVWTISAIMTLILGLRGDMATDHERYTNFFNRISSVDLKEALTGDFVMENGFAVFNKVISLVSDSTVVLMLVIAIITMGLITFAFKEKTKIPWLALLLFFTVGDYFDSFNLVRQIMAVAICFFATRYMAKGKKNFFKYVALVLLASTFHQASLIMIPMFFLMRLRYTKRTVLIYLGVGAFAYAFLAQIINKFIEWFPQYDMYADYKGVVVNFNSVLPNLGVLLFVLVCIYFFGIEFDTTDSNNRIALHGATLAVLFLTLGMNMYIAARFAHFFKPFVIVAAVNVINNFKLKGNKKALIYAVSIVAVLFTIVVQYDSPYNPYYLHSDVMGFFK